MDAKKKNALTRFLIWRAKHISNKQFVYLLAMLIGFTSGLGAVVLKNATHFFQHLLEGRLVQSYHQAFYFVFPLIGLGLVLLIIKYGIRNKVSHGIPSTLYAMAKRKGFMKRHQMFGSMLTAPITVGFGGSVGLEGPTVATGAAISANIAKLFHMNQSTRNLLIGCAAAGAMSSIFKAPIAAIIFAVEVFSLQLTTASMLPLLLASITAILTSYFFFGSDILLPVKLADAFSPADVPYFLLLGLAAGGISIYFTSTYEYIQKGFDRLSKPHHKLLVGGSLLGGLIYLIPPLYGEGFEVVNSLLEGNPTAVLKNSPFEIDPQNFYMLIALLMGLVFFKIIAASLTFGAGGVGGIFAPTLFMGAVLGHSIGKIINHLDLFGAQVSVTQFTLVGMSGLMAGVLHAPLTAIFLIAELTGGYELFIPLMITAATAYTITKYIHPHSVYTMELGRKGELITHDKDQAVLTLMDIESVIETNFIPLSPGQDLGHMVQDAIIKSNRNIFPVVSEEGTLLGVVLLDDVRPVMFQRSLYHEIKVRDLMQHPPAIIDVDRDKMKDIMQKFQESGAWNLPLIKNGKYHGFISKSKLLTAYRRKLIHFNF